MQHVTQGRGGKQEKREHYKVIGIKTDKESVPKYGFHHVHITKNILSPNTMLSFVPHLRDLAEHEETRYRRWLENLESMDKTSGFDTLSRSEKVRKTCQKERAMTLLLYLDYWLDTLSIEGCSKNTLIRHMAHQSDVLTPQQASSLRNSYGDNDLPQSTKGVGMFMNAFDTVFSDGKKWSDGAVTLRDVLLLDKSVDAIVDSKKYLKDTPSQHKPSEDNATVINSVETYSFLGCLICFSHSCEHGEYGVDNERRRFSIETTGGLKPLIRKKATQVLSDLRADDDRRGFKPCGEDCFLNGRPGTRARSWSETEITNLRTAAALFKGLNTAVQCTAAVYMGKPCWDVNRQLEKMGPDLTLPADYPPRPPVAKVKSVAWYDRFKKTLIGDWQDHTITHEHHKKDHFDPCHHDGPCTKENCACLKNGLMCERFCSCTAETCAVKFTGCACHSQGRTCIPRQKGEKSCICVQLNRECDPALCASCGATDRANPRNMDDDELFTHGCQNCALQRGKSKAVIHGKSTIEGCGYGLFTTENISQDDFVIEYVGELISQDEGVRREARRGDVFDEEHNSSYLFTLLEQEGIWVDAEIYGNLSRYINHQDDFGKAQGCNITPKILYVGGEYRIKFSALRDISAGEELFFNYGENFPNLTKKLLDEQKAEENKSKKRRAKKGSTGEEDGAKKGPGRKQGAKLKKQKRKSFAATRLESDLDDEDTNDGSTEDFRPGPNIAKARKRKRNTEPDSDDGGGLFDRAIRNRSKAHADDLEMADAEILRRRTNKNRRILDDEDDEDDEIDENFDAEYRDKGPASGAGRRSGDRWRQRLTADDSAAEEGTPSRIRMRRKEDQFLHSSQIGGSDRTHNDPLNLDKLSRPIPPEPSIPKKKRGRPRKVQPRDEIAETDDNADDNSIGGGANMGNHLSQSVGIDSDASSNSHANRGRVRKRPARYDE